MFVVFVLLACVGVLELTVLVEVADRIGVLETLLLLAVTTVGGVWVVKHEGLGIARRVQQQVQRGEVPAAGVVDGLLLLVAGLLLVVPGFVTDAAALLLLVPFVRRPLRDLVLRRLRSRLQVTTFATRAGRGFVAADVTDVRSYETPRPPAAAPGRELPGGPDHGGG